MSHRLMHCTRCDLVYVSNPPGQAELAEAYQVSGYDSSEEATDAAISYMTAIKPLLAKLPRKERVLEIGSGTGILLELLQSEGFTTLVGVEPSSAAIGAAPAHRREWLREGIFVESDFALASFDLICCFMTMEHVQDPKATAMAARRLLRPGGAFVTVTHDYTSLVNHLLGRKSPIIDIEHMQIFLPAAASVSCSAAAAIRISASGHSITDTASSIGYASRQFRRSPSHTSVLSAAAPGSIG